MTMLEAAAAIYGGASRDDAGRVGQALRDFDVHARVEIAASWRSSDVTGLGAGHDLSWFVLISIPIRLLFERLALRDGGAAPQLRELTRRVTEPGDGRCTGLLIMQDTETGIDIVLMSSLPAAAWQSLPGVDLIAYTFGPVHYDTRAAAWGSVFDRPAG